ncbi:MAG: hypothetical protein RR614_09190 [Eubacterium sp.]
MSLPLWGRWLGAVQTDEVPSAHHVPVVEKNCRNSAVHPDKKGTPAGMVTLKW